MPDLQDAPLTEPATSELPAGRWTLDRSQSSVAFAVKHFWGLVTVRGGFTEMTGRLQIDPSGTPSGELRIDSSSVATGIRRRDEHLRSATWLGAERYPEIEFTPAALRAVTARQLVISGMLFIAGHGELVDVAVEVAQEDARLTLTGALTVDRTAFGMTWGPLSMTAGDAALGAHLILRPES